MTIERDNDAVDDLVRKTYLQDNDERAPEHLNREILRLATSELRQRSTMNMFSAAWTKPLAWAATIMFSLAIVLELTEIPGTPADIAAPATESIREEFKPQDAGVIEEAENQARLRAGPNQQPVRNDEVSAKSLSDTASPGPVTPAATITPSLAAESGADEIVLQETDTAADNFARSIPETERTDARQKSADFALTAEKKESDTEQYCDEAARNIAEDWLKCIETLSKAGAAAEAHQEYEAFKLKFPARANEFDANK